MFKEITQEIYENGEWQNIMAAFQHLPEFIKNICTDLQNVANNENELYIIINDKCKILKASSSKEIQSMLKRVYLKVEPIDWKKKYNLELPMEQMRYRTKKAQRLVKNPKLRNILLRVWHGDIFSNERMKRFNMIEDDMCGRCKKYKETIDHQFLKCKEARLFWSAYNNLMWKIGLEKCKVTTLNDIILPNSEDNELSFAVKIIVLNINMQKERPRYTFEIFKNYIRKYALIERLLGKKESEKWDNICEALNDM
jgi:hypothetical protein